MPCSSQAWIVSSSRFEPPGWMIAVTPAAAASVGAVAEREERVGGQHRPPGPRAGLLDGDPDRVEPAHLAGAHADDLAVLGQDDRVRLDRRADAPGEGQVAALGLGRRAPGRRRCRRPGRPRAGPSPGRAGPPRSGAGRSPARPGRRGRSARRGRAAGRCSARSAWSSATPGRPRRSRARGSPRGTGRARTSARPWRGRPAGSGRRCRRRR